VIHQIGSCVLIPQCAKRGQGLADAFRYDTAYCEAHGLALVWVVTGEKRQLAGAGELSAPFRADSI